MIQRVRTGGDSLQRSIRTGQNGQQPFESRFTAVLANENLEMFPVRKSQGLQAAIDVVGIAIRDDEHGELEATGRHRRDGQ